MCFPRRAPFIDVTFALLMHKLHEVPEFESSVTIQDQSLRIVSFLVTIQSRG